MKLTKQDMNKEIIRMTIASGIATNITFVYEPERCLLWRCVLEDYGALRDDVRRLPEDWEEIKVSQSSSRQLEDLVKRLDFSAAEWETIDEVDHPIAWEDEGFTEVFIALLSDGSEFSYYALHGKNTEFQALFFLFRYIWKKEYNDKSGSITDDLHKGKD